MAANPNPLSLLILSDIHFGSSAFSPDFALKCSPPPHLISNPVPMLDNLLEVISQEHIDSILITGDLTSKGGPSEFRGCVDTIKKIAECTSVNSEDIFFAFGNHDTNWKISKLSEEDEFKDDLYLDVAATIGNIYVENLNECEKGPIIGSGIYCRDKYVVYIVNSGYYSNHDQEYKHGKLGTLQYNWLKECVHKYDDPSKWHVMMLHHHPFKYSYPDVVPDISCLEEGSELVDLMGNSHIDIVFHGHRHHPKLFTQLLGNWKSPVTFICAGSLAVNDQYRNHGQIPNLFHIVNIERRSEGKAATGVIKSFQYSSMEGWIPVTISSFVPLDPIQTFGSTHTREENEKEAEALISTNFSKTSESCIELPEYTSLPLSLRCMRQKDLNELLIEIVNNKFASKLVGEYPKPVAIIRTGSHL